MSFPLDKMVIATPEVVNPSRSMPAFQFDRSVDLLEGPQSSGGGGFIPPMWLIKVDASNVKVTNGTVNGITPTGIVTNIDVSGTDSTWAIYLHATLGADGIPTAVEVLSDDTGAVPADDEDNSYILIGNVTVAASAITSVDPTLAWSQTFVTCGRDPDDPATTPGTYYWQVA